MLRNLTQQQVAFRLCHLLFSPTGTGRPGDFGIEMEATQNRAWANCCFGSSKAASAMKKCLKGSINSSSCLKEDNLNLETSFPHGEKLVRTRNVRFPCHEELSAK
jgi:hypothetical protein